MMSVLMTTIICLTGVCVVAMFLLASSTKVKSELELKAKSKDFEGQIKVKSEDDTKK